jgi:outer membrane protein assembly factor BamD
MNNRMRNQRWEWLALWLAAGLALAGCMGGKKAASAPATSNSAEPDKVLYENAMNDMKHSRFDVGRLALQTLINTYPDSEYLAKAKLAVADSYYKEGGTSGLTQAVAEYQDFITFFPFLDEAAYAQMQVGMAYYRRMEKPDRDRDEALEAEGAFQTYLQKYSSSPLVPQAQQRLREVQEVLAEGDFRVASFYYLRRNDRAAAARLSELVGRYPLYSQADHANWMLASIFDRTEHADVAAQFYGRIVKDYPLSPLVADAKAKLVKYGVPVPQPDPTALARMQSEQQTARPRSLISRPLGALKTGPDVRMAARSGAPTMTPESADNTEALTPGGPGNSIVGVAANAAAAPGPTASTGGGTGAFVETVSPGSSGGAATAPADPPAAVIQPVAGSEGTQTISSGDPAPGGTDANGTAGASTNPASSASDATPPASSSKESSSKKKKGFRKLIP